MSRVAKMPVALPKGVECTVAKDSITVKGPKGTLKFAMPQDVEVECRALKSVQADDGGGPTRWPVPRVRCWPTWSRVSAKVTSASSNWSASAIARALAGQGPEPDARLFASGRIHRAGRHHDHRADADRSADRRSRQAARR